MKKKMFYALITVTLALTISIITSFAVNEERITIANENLDATETYHAYDELPEPKWPKG